MKRRVSCAATGHPDLNKESRAAYTAQKNVSVMFLSSIYPQSIVWLKQ